MSSHRGREILWVVPKWPLPAQDGARIATCRLIEGLVRRGHKIDLVAFGAPEAAEDSRDGGLPAEELDPTRVLGVRRVFKIGKAENAGKKAALSGGERGGCPAPGSGPGSGSGSGFRGEGFVGRLQLIPSLLLRPWLPVTFRHYATRLAACELEGVLKRGPDGGAGWFAMVYDGLHPAIHSSRLGLYRLPPHAPPRIIYRAHNLEADIWRRMAGQTRLLPLRLFLRFQAWRVQAFERSLVSAASGVAAVSLEDWNAIRALDSKARGRVVPIGYDFEDSIPRWEGAANGKLDLLFVGRLDWPPNRDGLTWFLKRVWGPARRLRPELRLSVVGSGDGSWLRAMASGPGAFEGDGGGEDEGGSGVKFLGRIDRLDSAYRGSLLSIVPIFYGSGTRVKVIESCRYGRACLSTALGVEGTGLVAGESYLRAETEEEWIGTLAGLNPSRALEIALKARQEMRERFDLSRAAGEFEGLLDELE